MVSVNDLYLLPEYGKINECLEHGDSISYHFSHELGSVYYMFIKREIPIKYDGERWYDIITPYGYGGPVLACEDPSHKEQVLVAFEADFNKYCEENRIVSEFIRFHPMLNNAEHFKDVYDVEKIRTTIGTDLTASDDPISSEFSKSCKKNIKRLETNGISYNIIEKPDSLEKFKKIYYSTMDRNEAKDFYYFDDEYFNRCVCYLKDHIVLVEAVKDGETIAMGMYFVYGKTIHIHLSGTLSEYIKLSPAYILRYAITLWGISKGYEVIHHGGGRTNSENDQLMLFKKRFGSLEFNFYVGKKIRNAAVYDFLCSDIEPSDYFPLYRSR